MVLLLAAYFIVPRIPGTLRIGENGMSAWGTGVIRHYYKDAPTQPMLVEYYSGGRMARSEWFKPDGTSVESVDWNYANGGQEGWGVYLRDDGSVYKRVYYINGLGVKEKDQYFDSQGKEMTREAWNAWREANEGTPGGVRLHTPGRTVKSAR
ncbi:MAG: hypothetical protein AABZ53_14605 [Planctomycetota bacterium]